MPIYEYQAEDPKQGCSLCRSGFEHLQTSLTPLKTCPNCGTPVTKLISAPNVGGSKTGLDDRAKAAGFHKLEKLGKGEYEKRY